MQDGNGKSLTKGVPYLPRLVVCGTTVTADLEITSAGEAGGRPRHETAYVRSGKVGKVLSDGPLGGNAEEWL